MGTAGFGIPTLDLINKNYNLKAIITNHDKPSGRGLKIKNSPVKNYAIKNNISYYQPKNLKNLDFIEVIKDLNPDFVIVVAFRMIPESIWRIPKFGTINLHASLLPNYRGSAPINWVLINNESQTGITSFFIDENIDTGDILFQQKIKIDERINAGDLKLAGKSGTAQVVDINSREEYDEVRTNQLLRDHAIFIGYAPYDNPRYSIAVIVENGESGGRVAGPIAKTVLKELLNDF